MERLTDFVFFDNRTYFENSSKMVQNRKKRGKNNIKIRFKIDPSLVYIALWLTYNFAILFSRWSLTRKVLFWIEFFFQLLNALILTGLCLNVSVFDLFLDVFFKIASRIILMFWKYFKIIHAHRIEFWSCH